MRERLKWGSYMRAYEDMIRNTATDFAPWYVVPADHKWFTQVVVADVIVQALEELDLSYPKLTPTQRAAIRGARRTLR